MIRVLIVDDEILVRQGIKTMVDWNKYGFEIVGEAGDGEKALALAKEKVPDIVLTDLVMPKMDGLELIRHLKSCLPKTKIVVLSCHKDYELVREAMQHWGALDYLFKLAMQPQDILDTMLKVKNIILKDLEQEKQQEEYQKIIFKNSILEFSRYLQNIIRQGIDSNDMVTLEGDQGYFDFSDSYSVISFVTKDRKPLLPEQEEAFCHLMDQVSKNRGIESRIFSVSSNEYSMIIKKPGKQEWEPFRALLTDICKEIQKLAGQSEIKVCYGIGELGTDINSFGGVYEKTHAIALKQTHLFSLKSYSNDVEKVLQYLNQNYASNIKLSDIANHVHMNESYLSTIIKKQTGYGFTDILSQIRVNHAKSMIENSSLSVNDIAERVGFSSWSYFSRVFKKSTGLSPAEYRKKIRSNNI
ncbi:MAG: response regulator transcription factor [Acetivibrionales bacterium]|jgi:two-component system response regulator YesN